MNILTLVAFVACFISLGWNLKIITQMNTVHYTSCFCNFREFRVMQKISSSDRYNLFFDFCANSGVVVYVKFDT